MLKGHGDEAFTQFLFRVVELARSVDHSSGGTLLDEFNVDGVSIDGSLLGLALGNNGSGVGTGGSSLLLGGNIPGSLSNSSSGLGLIGGGSCGLENGSGIGGSFSGLGNSSSPKSSGRLLGVEGSSDLAGHDTTSSLVISLSLGEETGVLVKFSLALFHESLELKSLLLSNSVEVRFHLEVSVSRSHGSGGLGSDGLLGEVSLDLGKSDLSLLLSLSSVAGSLRLERLPGSSGVKGSDEVKLAGGSGGGGDGSEGNDGNERSHVWVVI